MKPETKNATEYDYAATLKKLEAYETEGAKKYKAGAKPKASHGNAKTGPAICEATLPGVTCGPLACRTCLRSCYAKRIAIYREAVAHRYAWNTAARRADPAAYYRYHFAIADLEGLPLRLNESGDFETVEHVRTVFRIAKAFPAVQVVGYTRRPELIAEIRKAPKNVHIRFSTFCDGRDDFQQLRPSDLVAGVSETSTNCPSQLAQAAGKKWTCSDCAAHRCGCFGAGNITFKKH